MRKSKKKQLRRPARAAARKVYRKTPQAVEPPVPGQLLVPRKQTATMLACSLSNIVRLENAGKLKVINPSGLPTGQKFHLIEQVRRLAGIEPSAIRVEGER